MIAWVLLALLVVGAIGFAIYKFMTAEVTPPKPVHNYEISKRTYNDGSELWLTAYRNGEDLYGQPRFTYIGENSSANRFKATTYTTYELAAEAAQKHWDNQCKSEETLHKLMITESKPYGLAI